MLEAESTTAVVEENKPDIVDQLLKPEVQESLNVLLENLPKLAEMVTTLTKVYEISQAAVTDPVLRDDLTGGVREFIKPIQTKVKGYASAAIEAKERAEKDHSPVSLFGLLRMLKDPQVQKMLQFAQAYFAVLSEREHRS